MLLGPDPRFDSVHHTCIISDSLEASRPDMQRQAIYLTRGMIVCFRSAFQTRRPVTYTTQSAWSVIGAPILGRLGSAGLRIDGLADRAHRPAQCRRARHTELTGLRVRS
jgi:hypothetical protein